MLSGGMDRIALYGALINRAVLISDLVASRGASSSAVKRYTSGVPGATILRLHGHRFVLCWKVTSVLVHVRIMENSS